MNKLKIIKWIMSLDFDCLKKHLAKRKFIYISSTSVIALSLIFCWIFNITIDAIWETVEWAARAAGVSD